MREKIFGHLPDGSQVMELALYGGCGIKANIITYGAVIKNLEVPDRKGMLADIILGQDTLEGYVTDPSASAALIGRVANRIENAAFYLNGKKYQLEVNEHNNCLHSGRANYAGRNFRVADRGNNWASLQLTDDGNGGFPGKSSLTVTYTLTESGALEALYEFSSDEDTPVSLTNHGYFNLSGGKERNILRHKMKLNTEFYTPVRNDGIPTGEIRHVRGTKLDFTSRRLLSEVLDSEFNLDHNFVLKGREYGLAGELWDDCSGRKMEVYTDCPGIQIYTGNHFDGKTRGKKGVFYERYGGICFETQEFPNAVNVKHFPDCIVKKNTTFTCKTVYKFCVF